MIIVNIYEDDETNLITGFDVKGHAGYAAKGKDIVCAAVSALSVATVKAIQSRYKANISEHEGFLKLIIESPDRASNLMIKPFREGMKDITEQYSDYVKMHHYYL